jgi:transcriptional regulator with PAS, ATPase and Fis domain
MNQQNECIENLKSQIADLSERLEKYIDLDKKYQHLIQALREKEEFNFALFQFSPVTAIVVDSEGKVIKSNTAKRNSGDRLPNIGDIMYRDYARNHTIDMYGELLQCIKTGQTKSFPEMHYCKKILSITIAPFPKGAIITSQDITERVQSEQDRNNLIKDLRKALSEVETLRGLLPICAACKKIRDDKGYWNTVEDYFGQRSSIDFSHTLCPDCIKQLYPDLWEKMPSKVTKMRHRWNHGSIS